MSLIDSFSKPRWKHAKAEIRKSAVEELDDPETLREIISSDPDAAIRSLALTRIKQPQLLEELIAELDGSLRDQARSQRLGQLLPDDSNLENIGDDDTLIQIAGLTDDDDLAAAAVTQVSKPEVLLKLAASHPQSRLRLAAALKIDDLDQLRELMKQSKNRDKAVFRHCKEKLEHHQAEQKFKEERDARIELLAKKADALPAIMDATEFKGSYLLIRQEWPALDTHADAAQRSRIEKALQFGEKQFKEANEAEASARSEVEKQQAAKQQFSDLLSELEALEGQSVDLADPAAISTLHATLNDIEERWVGALREATATAEQTGRCKSLLSEWRSMLTTEQRLLEKSSRIEKSVEEAGKTDQTDFLSLQRQLKKTESLIASFVWPESHISLLPEPIKRLHEQKEVIASKIDKLKKGEQQNLNLLESSFTRFEEELTTNHFDNADREFRKLKNVLRRLSPAQQQSVQQKLRPMVARLNEIHDWQGFAIEPKKLDLISRMEALSDQAEDPDVLAGKIKAMQAEWKSLGHLAPHRDQELWHAFKKAADKAYEPCKAAFAQRAAHYAQNVERRMELIRQLADYDQKMHWPEAEGNGEDYQSPDWKLVQKTLDTARDAFRNIKPVDRKGERKTQKKLKIVCDRIYGHIKQEYERNIALKESLAERARELVEKEDLQAAISQAKTIQREWKQVGMTPLRVDRKLWKKFRSACDEVFARLDQERKQNRQAMDGKIQEAEEVLQQAKTLVASGDDEQRVHLKRDLIQLRDSLRAFDLPARFRQQLSRQFSDLEKKAEDLLAAQRRKKDQAKWLDLTRLIRAAAQGPDNKDGDQESPDLPKGLEYKALQSFLNDGPGTSDSSDLRETCIALEILLELDSPAEDKKARMEYQMKRLVEGMGGQQLAGRDAQLMSLINQLLSLRPSQEWAERFCLLLDSAQGGPNS